MNSQDYSSLSQYNSQYPACPSRYPTQPTPQYPVQQAPQYAPQYPVQQAPQYAPQFPAQYPVQQAPQYAPQYPVQQAPQFPAQYAPQYAPQYPAQYAPQFPAQYPVQQAPQYAPQYPAQYAPQYPAQYTHQYPAQQAPQYAPQYPVQQAPQYAPQYPVQQAPQYPVQQAPQYPVQQAPQYPVQQAPQYAPQYPASENFAEQHDAPKPPPQFTRNEQTVPFDVGEFAPRYARSHMATVVKSSGYTGTRLGEKLFYVRGSTIIRETFDTSICAHGDPNGKRVCYRCAESLDGVYMDGFAHLLNEFKETSIINGHVDNPAIPRVNETPRTKGVKDVIADWIWLKIHDYKPIVHVKTPDGTIVQYDVIEGVSSDLKQALMQDITRFKYTCTVLGVTPDIMLPNTIPELFELRDCN